MTNTPRESQERSSTFRASCALLAAITLGLLATGAVAANDEEVSAEVLAQIEERLVEALEDVAAETDETASFDFGMEQEAMVAAALESAGTRFLSDQLSRDRFGVTVGPFGMYLIRETVEFENGISVRFLCKLGPWTGPSMSDDDSRRAGDEKVAVNVLEEVEKREAVLVEQDATGKMYAFKGDDRHGQVLLLNPPSVRAVWLEALNDHALQFEDEISENMWFGLGKVRKNGQIKKKEETFTIPNRRGTDIAWEVRSLDKTPTEYWLSLRYPKGAKPKDVSDGAELNRELSEITMPFGIRAERVGFAITVTKGDPPGTYQLRLRDSTGKVVAAVSYLLTDED